MEMCRNLLTRLLVFYIQIGGLPARCNYVCVSFVRGPDSCSCTDECWALRWSPRKEFTFICSTLRVPRLHWCKTGRGEGGFFFLCFDKWVWDASVGGVFNVWLGGDGGNNVRSRMICGSFPHACVCLSITWKTLRRLLKYLFSSLTLRGFSCITLAKGLENHKLLYRG